MTKQASETPKTSMDSTRQSPEKKGQKVTSTQRRRWTGIVVIILLLLILGVTTKTFFLFNHIRQTDQSVMQQQKVQAETIDGLQSQVASLTSTMKKASEHRVNGDSTWTRSQVAYLIQLANYAAYFQKNVATATACLEAANKALVDLNDPSTLPLQKAIEEDLLQLKQASDPSIEEIYTRLSALDAVVNTLPEIGGINAGSEKAPVSTEENEKADNWKEQFKASLSHVKALVVIRKSSSSLTPAVSETEKALVYQNLHFLISQAQWALLRGESSIYKNSLARAIDWVKQYFLTSNSHVDHFLDECEALEKIDLNGLSPSVKHSLEALKEVNDTE